MTIKNTKAMRLKSNGICFITILVDLFVLFFSNWHHSFLLSYSSGQFQCVCVFDSTADGRAKKEIQTDFEPFIYSTVGAQWRARILGASAVLGRCSARARARLCGVARGHHNKCLRNLTLCARTPTQDMVHGENVHL